MDDFPRLRTVLYDREPLEKHAVEVDGRRAALRGRPIAKTSSSSGVVVWTADEDEWRVSHESTRAPTQDGVLFARPNESLSAYARDATEIWFRARTGGLPVWAGVEEFGLKMLVPDVNLSLVKIRTLAVKDSPLTSAFERVPTNECGFLSLTASRRAIFVLEQDSKAYDLPLIGVWVKSEDLSVVYGCALRYLLNSFVKERVSVTKDSLVVCCVKEDSSLVFFEAKPKGAGRGALLLTREGEIETDPGVRAECFRNLAVEWTLASKLGESIQVSRFDDDDDDDDLRWTHPTLPKPVPFHEDYLPPSVVDEPPPSLPQRSQEEDDAWIEALSEKYRRLEDAYSVV